MLDVGDDQRIYCIAYDQLLTANPDPAAAARAARNWCDWEDAVNSLEEGWTPSERYADPGVLIHGRFDIGGPPGVAWLLHQAWPGSQLHLVRTGHQGGDEMTEHMMTALNRFAVRGRPARPPASSSAP